MQSCSKQAGPACKGFVESFECELSSIHPLFCASVVVLFLIYCGNQRSKCAINQVSLSLSVFVVWIKFAIKRAHEAAYGNEPSELLLMMKSLQVFLCCCFEIVMRSTQENTRTWVMLQLLVSKVVFTWLLLCQLTLLFSTRQQRQLVNMKKVAIYSSHVMT